MGSVNTLNSLHGGMSGVALVLCQSNPVLNDGHSKNEAVIEGVRKQFIEKVVADHEEEGDDYSSD